MTARTTDDRADPTHVRATETTATTPEQERWAEASTVLRQHGENTPAHVAGRIGELAVAGDAAGVARWREIAARVDKLLAGSLQ